MNPTHATTPNTKPNMKLLTPGVIATTPPGTVEVPCTAHRLAPLRAVRIVPSVVSHEHVGVSMRARWTWAAVAALMTLASACGLLPTAHVPPPPTPNLVLLEPHPPLVDDGDPATLAAALRASIAYYVRLPRD